MNKYGEKLPTSACFFLIYDFICMSMKMSIVLVDWQYFHHHHHHYHQPHNVFSLLGHRPSLWITHKENALLHAWKKERGAILLFCPGHHKRQICVQKEITYCSYANLQNESGYSIMLLKALELNVNIKMLLCNISQVTV
jgi:hypothetical protein